MSSSSVSSGTPTTTITPSASPSDTSSSSALSTGTAGSFYKNLFYILVALLICFALITTFSWLRGRQRRKLVFSEARRLGLLVPGMPGYIEERDRLILYMKGHAPLGKRPEVYDVLDDRLQRDRKGEIARDEKGMTDWLMDQVGEGKLGSGDEEGLVVEEGREILEEVSLDDGGSAETVSVKRPKHSHLLSIDLKPISASPLKMEKPPSPIPQSELRFFPNSVAFRVPNSTPDPSGDEFVANVFDYWESLKLRQQANSTQLHLAEDTNSSHHPDIPLNAHVHDLEPTMTPYPPSSKPEIAHIQNSQPSTRRHSLQTQHPSNPSSSPNPHIEPHLPLGPPPILKISVLIRMPQQPMPEMGQSDRSDEEKEMEFVHEGYGGFELGVTEVDVDLN